MFIIFLYFVDSNDKSQVQSNLYTLGSPQQLPHERAHTLNAHHHCLSSCRISVRTGGLMHANAAFK
jgi:hypothetical protein